MNHPKHTQPHEQPAATPKTCILCHLPITTAAATLPVVRDPKTGAALWTAPAHPLCAVAGKMRTPPA